MSSNWPNGIDNFGTVTGTEATSSPNTAGLTHADLHNLLADAVTKLETKLQNYTDDQDATPNSGGGSVSTAITHLFYVGDETYRGNPYFQVSTDDAHTWQTRPALWISYTNNVGYGPCHVATDGINFLATQVSFGLGKRAQLLNGDSFELIATPFDDATPNTACTNGAYYTNGKWVIVGGGGSDGTHTLTGVIATANTVTGPFSLTNTPYDQVNHGAVGLAYNGSRWVAILGDSTNNAYIIYSDDLITWTEATGYTSSSFMANNYQTENSTICYGGGKFVIVDINGKVLTSTDGATWTSHTPISGVSNIESNMVWCGDRFAVCDQVTVWSSPDGITWTAQPSWLSQFPNSTFGGGWGLAWDGTKLWIGANSGIVNTTQSAFYAITYDFTTSTYTPMSLLAIQQPEYVTIALASVPS